MAKPRETTTDYDVDKLGELPDIDLVKKPDWVNLAPLDGLHNDNLMDKLLYKPALRFHGLTGGLWGQGLPGSPSVITDSRPPSYQVKDPLAPRYSTTALDQGSVYNNNIPAISRVTLRRRNTIAVVLVAAALLATIAAITGVVLHFIQPKSLLRANVRFTVANENYTDEMMNSSHPTFIKIARPLCGEMDLYYLTSGLAEFYLGCNVISLSKDEGTDNVAVHYTLDFMDNKVTNNKENIRQVILNKSGRHETNDTLFLVIDDFWVYLRSLRIDLGLVPYEGKPVRPRIPWRNDLDFITRESDRVDVDYNSLFVPLHMYSSSLLLSTPFSTNTPPVPRHVLPGVNHVLPRLTNHAINIALPLSESRQALRIPSDVLSGNRMSIVSHKHDTSNRQDIHNIHPTKTTHTVPTLPNNIEDGLDYLSNAQDYHRPHINVHDVKHQSEKKVEENYILNDRFRHIKSEDDMLSERNPVYIDTSFKMTLSSPAEQLTDSLSTYFDKSDDDLVTIEEGVPEKKRVLTLHSDIFVIGGIAKTPMVIMEHLPFPKPESSKQRFQHLVTKYSAPENELRSDFENNLAVSSLTQIVLSTTSVLKQSLETDRYDQTVNPVYIKDNMILIDNNSDSPKPNNIFSILPSETSSYVDSIMNTQTANVHVNPDIEMNEIYVGEAIKVRIPDVEVATHEDEMQNIDLPTEESITWINVLNLAGTSAVGTTHTHLSSNQVHVNSDVVTERKNNIDDIIKEFFPSDIYSNNHKDGTTESKVQEPEKSSNTTPLYEQNYLPYNQSMFEEPFLKSSSMSFSSFSDAYITHYTKDTHYSVTPSEPVTSQSAADFYTSSDNNIRWDPIRDGGRRLVPNIEHPNRVLLQRETGHRYNNNGYRGVNYDRANRRPANDQLGTNVVLPVQNGIRYAYNRRPRYIWNPYVSNHRKVKLGNFYFPYIHNNANNFREQNRFIDKYAYLKRYWRTPTYYSDYSVTYGNNLHFPSSSTDVSSSYGSGDRHSYRPPYSPPWMFYTKYVTNHRTVKRTHIYHKTWTDMPYVIPKLYIARNPPGKYSTNIAGFTKSYNVSDIYEMKTILKQLIDAMQNMSHKIDKMQVAINLINQTLHETKQPMHKLEHTFENMTKSFDNFNRNLNDIRDVLRDFKNFLKPFDQTIFNVDKIIDHIDKTVDNLEKTRQFVGVSMNDLSETVNDVTGTLFDLHSSLSHVNMSVFHVNNTAKYTNKTLDSMGKTLESLDLALRNMNLKIDRVFGGIDGINVSLTTINSTIKNSQGRLSKLQDRISNMNNTMARIGDTVLKHNKTYQQIMQTLENMNEPVMITKGTVLEVIDQLGSVDDELLNISSHMSKVDGELRLINGSLVSTLHWMKHMFYALEKLNVSMESTYDDITFNINSIDVVDAVGILLKINSTLNTIGESIDLNNVNIDTADATLNHLELNLDQLDKLLSSINTTFTSLNNTLKGLNATLIDIQDPLKSIDDNVNRVNYSFKDLNETFENIDKTLSIANTTIIRVDMTSNDINTKLANIKESLNQTQRSVGHFNNSVFNLNTSLNAISGPIVRLQEDLYNRNETLRMMKGKLDITTSSFEILKGNLNEIDITLDKILKKLDETDSALSRTNNSLIDVNNTIDAIEDINEEMNAKLSNLYLLFNSTQESLLDFGSAFPTLQDKMSETAFRIRDANDQIKEINKSLSDMYRKRNNSTTTYHKIKQNLTDVLKKVLNERKHLTDAIEFSNAVENDIKVLANNIESTGKNQQRLERNINFISQNLPKLQQEFENINTNSNILDIKSQETGNDLDTLRQEYDEIISNVEKYPSITLPSDIYLKIDTMIETLNMSKRLKDVWDSKIENTSKHIWDSKGYPLNVHNHLDYIVHNSDKLNKTMIDFTSFMDDIVDILGDISKENKTIRDTFKHINESLKKIDNINDATVHIEKDIAQIEHEIETDNKDFKEAQKLLRDKLSFIENIKRQFGDVHGTLNFSKVYGDVDELTESVEGHVRALVSNSRNISHLFHESKLKFDLTKHSFKAVPISIDSAGDEQLNDTTHSLQEIDVALDVVFDELLSFDNNQVIFSDYIDQLDNHTKYLTELLQNKSKSFDFVQKNKPLLISSFDEINDSFRNFSNDFDWLHLRFKHIMGMAEDIISLSANISNVDMSLIEDKKLLDDLYATILKLESELDTDLKTYQTLHKEFKLFDATSQDIETIKDEYAKFERILNNINKTIVTTDIESSIINRRLDDIEKDFERDLNSLKKYWQLNANLKILDNDFTNLIDKFKKTNTLIEVKSKDVKDINNKMQDLIGTFSNFTAASFNISDIYVNVEVKQLHNDFERILEDFSILRGDEHNLETKLNDLLQTLTSAPFSRYNLMRVLENDINPESVNIDQNIKVLNSQIDELTLRLIDISTDILFLNETLQTKEDRLTLDKQKQLVADLKFPHLEQSVSDMVDLINTLSESLKYPSQLLENSNKSLKDVFDKISLFPTLKLKDDTYKNDLHILSENIIDVQDKIEDAKDILSNINETIWVGNGTRYLHNETIEDIRGRYLTSKEQIAVTSKELNTIAETISLTTTLLLNVSNDISSLNTSVDLFETMSENMKDVVYNIATEKSKFQGSNHELQNLAMDLTSLDTKFNDTVVRFYALGNDTLYKDLQGVQTNVTLSKNEYEYISEDHNVLNNTLSRLEQTLKTLNETKYEDVHDKSKLDQINDLILNSLDEFSAELGVTNMENRILSNRLTPMNDTLKWTNLSLDNAIETLLRQEKKEFYKNSFPKELYDEIERKLEDIYFKNEQFRGVLGIANTSLDSLRKILAENSNVNISIENETDIFDSSYRSYGHNKWGIEKMREDHANAYSLFFTENGQEISENETINQLMERQHKLESILSHIRNYIRPIETTVSKNVVDGIENQVKEIVDLTKAIEKLRTYTNLINTQNEQSEYVDTVLQLAKTKLNSASDKVEYFQTEMNTYNSVFTGVKNPLIDATKEKIDELIYELNSGLMSTSLKTTNDEKEHDLMKSIISEKISRNLKGFQTLEDIKNFLNDSDIATYITQKHLLNIDQSLLSSINKLKEDDIVIEILQSELSSLKKLYLHQEKIDYINGNAPSLLSKMKKLNESVEGLQNKLGESYKDMVLVNNFKNLLDNKLMNSDKVFIDLDNISNALNITEKSLSDKEGEITSLQQSLNKIDKDIFKSDGNVIENTLKIIKEKYRPVYEIVNDGELISVNASNHIQNVNQKTSDIKTYLRDIYKELRNHGDINDQLNVLKEDVKEGHGKVNIFTNELNGIIDTITNADIIIDAIKRRFIGANNPSLNQEIENLTAEVKEHLKTGSHLLDNLNNMKDIQLSNGMDFDHVKEALNKTLHTLTDLKLSNMYTNDTIGTINVTLNRLDDEMKYFDQKLSDFKIKTGNITNRLEDLESKLSHNQLEQYVNDTLPHIFDDIEKFENLLDKLFHEIGNISDIYANTTKEMQNTKKHAEGSNIDLHLDDLYPYKNDMKMKITEASNMYEYIKENLRSFVSSIDTHVNSNNTFDDIKSRFDHYADEIKSLFKITTPLFNVTNEVKLISQTALDVVDDYNIELIRVSNTNTMLGKHISSLDTIQENIDTTKQKLNKTNRDIKYVKNRLDFIEDKFTTVNSSYLTNMRSMINSTVSELKDKQLEYEYNLNDNVSKSLETVSGKLENEVIGNVTTIKNLSHLQIHTDNLIQTKISAGKQIAELKNELVILNDSELPEHEKKIINTRKIISNLLKNYEDENKNDYIQANWPGILSTYIAVNQSLIKQSKNIGKIDVDMSSMNNTIDYIDKKIDNISNVFLSLQDYKLDLKSGMENTKYLSSIINNKNTKINKLNMKQFTPERLQLMTLGEIKQLFENMKNTLNEMEETLTFTENKINVLNDSLVANEYALSKTDQLLDQFLNKRNKSIDIGDSLQTVYQSISNTNQTLKSVEDHFHDKLNRFNKIKDAYPNVTNADIQNLLDNAKKHMNFVHMRLPLVNQLFESKSVSGLETLNKTLRLVQNDLISQFIPDQKMLQDVVDNSEIMLSNISKQIEHLIDNDSHYRDDAMQLFKHVTNFDTVLDELEQSLVTQTKRDLIDRDVPVLKEKLNKLKNSTLNGDNKLFELENTWEMLNKTFNFLQTELSSKPALNVSLDLKTLDLNYTRHEMNNLSEMIINVFHNIEEIPIFNISFEDIVLNDSYSVSDVETIISNIEHPLNDLSIKVDKLHKNNSDVSMTLSLLSNYSQMLQEKMIDYTLIENQVINFTADFNDVLSKQNLIDSNLALADHIIRNLRDDLEKTVNDFIDYAPDDSRIQSIIQNAQQELMQLNEKFGNVSSKISGVNDTYVQMNISLYNSKNNIDELSKSITKINQSHTDAYISLTDINKILDTILNDTHLLNITLDKVRDDLLDLNNSLVIEDKKTTYIKTTLPVLQKKYKETQNTFDFFNKTFDEMENKLMKLEEFVEKIKTQMEKYDNINISMSNFTTNLTDMENRLLNMQDHYGNIKEIVSNLKNDLYGGAHTGNNVSFENVTYMFSSYNLSIDKVDMVLGKIDMEFTDMDDQFASMNDTLIEIDTALDSYAQNDIETDVLNEEITEIELLLANKENKLTTMKDKVKELNGTFADLQDIYRDVVNSTASKNLIFKDTLLNVSNLIKNVQDVLLQKLKDNHLGIKDNFYDMNTTFTQHVSTSNELIDLLTKVQSSQDELTNSLDSIKDGVGSAKNHTNNLQSLLGNVADLLNEINSTLKSEQAKHDYIKKNLLSFEDWLNELNQKFTIAKSSLDSTDDFVSNTSALFTQLQTRLLKNKRTKFTMDEARLSSINKELQFLETNYMDLNDTFQGIKNDISNHEDTNSNMSSLISRYLQINQTINSLYDNLDTMIENTTFENQRTKPVIQHIQLIDEHIDRFDIALSQAENFTENLTSIEKRKSLLGSEIKIISSYLDSSDEDLNMMSSVYENVSTERSTTLKLELQNLVAEYNQQIIIFQNLNNTFDMFKDDFLDTSKKSQYIDTQLKREFQSFEILRTALNLSENVISDVFPDIENLNSTLKTLHGDSNILLNNVVNLHERIKNLNHSLNEEMSKEMFITNNYGYLNSTYNLIKLRMDDANSSIFNAFDRTTNLNDYISSLSTKLDAFSAINMSLDSEQKSIDDERRRLNELMDLFKNVSEAHSNLPIADMTNANKTFADLRSDYDNFENALKRLEDHLNSANETVIDTNNRLDALNSTLIDIHDTADQYEKMENIISDQVDSSVKANAALNYTKDVAKELEKQIKYLNESLRSLENTFKEINDPSLESAKNDLEQLLKMFTDQLNSLKNSNNEMDEISTVIHDRLGSINDTLYSTKVMIGHLKDHITSVNKSSALLEKNLENMNSKQKSANNTANELKPKLDLVFRDLENLTSAFNREQQKLDFLEREKPLLQLEYENLEGQLSDINRRLSMTDFQLADLKYDIKTTGSKLDKFKTLNITTGPEMDRWTVHYETVNDLSSKFVRLSSSYNLLQDDIKNLDRRNSTEDELKTQIKSIRDTLQDTSQALDRKNDTIKVIGKDISEIESVLEVFDMTMKDLRNLQQNGTNTKEIMDRALDSIANITSAVANIVNMKDSITDITNHIQTKYKSISHKTWLQKLSSLKKITSIEDNKLKLNSANLKDINQVMKITTAKFNKTYKDLNEQMLNRDNVRNEIQRIDRDVRSAKETVVDNEGKLNQLGETLSSVNSTLFDTFMKLKQMNDTLHLEWQKATFVNVNLPKLQEKLMAVNETFAKNIPSAKELKSQISYLTILLEKIEDKMISYAIEDADNSISGWRNDIRNLNRTVREIITQNEQSDRLLTDLKSKLWSDKPMFAKHELLNDVKQRFADFNRSLDDIEAKSDSISLQLGSLDTNTTNMAIDMENRDLALTTTTTPAAPPDWLTFTSSGSGVIAQDKGYLECSAKDLTSWEIMKISRVHSDGTEQDMAAWKVGMGARKPRTLRDRRIRAKRVLDGQGAGKLQINITSVQCVDEAKYFCSIDSHSMWPLKTDINVINPPEDSLEPEFPTEVFEDKVANFSCTGHPGYPNGRLIWKIRRANEAFFKDFDFYSARSKVVDEKCTRTETNTVGYQFDMHWNSTRIRCYIEGTDFYGEGIIRILPYSICNKVRDLGKIRHPYTPHKYIVCDRGLNIMQCPGKTCYDQAEGNCVQCKASDTGGDPCRGQPPFSFVAHETDCKKYYICMGNTKSIKRCAKGYFSSAVRGACTLAYAQSDCAKKKG